MWSVQFLDDINSSGAISNFEILLTLVLTRDFWDFFLLGSTFRFVVFFLFLCALPKPASFKPAVGQHGGGGAVCIVKRLWRLLKRTASSLGTTLRSASKGGFFRPMIDEITERFSDGIYKTAMVCWLLWLQQQSVLSGCKQRKLTLIKFDTGGEKLLEKKCDNILVKFNLK